MATYAIGDIQGCYRSFMALLEKIAFNPAHDVLWLAGDLVNRGKDSLSVLRFIYQERASILTVLGNHDLHLLAVYYGATTHKIYDTIDDILAAPEAEELCSWLRTQPLLHYDKTFNAAITHAGIYPLWSLPIAQAAAQEVETVLRSDDFKDFLHHMYGNMPIAWHPELQGWERLRFITNAFTRMRLVSEGGHLDLRKKGSPLEASEHYHPWFLIKPRPAKKVRLIFGHWAALECDTQGAKNVYAIDSGCIWGNSLTALRLEDNKRFSVNSCEPD